MGRKLICQRGDLAGGERGERASKKDNRGSSLMVMMTRTIMVMVRIVVMMTRTIMMMMRKLMAKS